MNRPYVICHMLTSLDGKIDGAFMSAPETGPVAAEYGRLRGAFGCQATMYGATTMEEVYAEGRAPVLESCPVCPPVAFALKDAARLEGNGLWLRYLK